MIIGISGKAGTGKDYLTTSLLAPFLCRDTPYVIVSFADHFKVECIVKEKLDREKVYGRKDAFTRSRLQKKGTEEGRDIYGENIWVDILNEQIQQYYNRGIKMIFITDCRFLNEIEYVKSHHGIVIRVEANDRNHLAMVKENGLSPEILNHPSETCEYKDWDYIIDNSIENAESVPARVLEIVKSISKKVRKFPTLLDAVIHYASFPDERDDIVVEVDSYEIIETIIQLYKIGLSDKIRVINRFVRPDYRDHI